MGVLTHWSSCGVRRTPSPSQWRCCRSSRSCAGSTASCRWSPDDTGRQGAGASAHHPGAAVALSVIVVLVVAATAIAVGGGGPQREALTAAPTKQAQRRWPLPTSWRTCFRGMVRIGWPVTDCRSCSAQVMRQRRDKLPESGRLPGSARRRDSRRERSAARTPPNMPMIKRTGNVGVTTLPATTKTAESLPPAKRKKDRAVLRRCEAAAPRGPDPNTQVDQLINEWATVFHAGQRVTGDSRCQPACGFVQPRDAVPGIKRGAEGPRFKAELRRLPQRRRRAGQGDQRQRRVGADPLLRGG